MFDAHVHLCDSRFANDLPRLIRRTKSAGVDCFFCAATRPADSAAVLDLAKRDAAAVPFIGTHPWYSGEYDAESFYALLKSEPRANIGEIGLDNRRSGTNQTAVFADQIKAAALFRRPCAVHCVKAFDDIARALKSLPQPPALLFHGFSGTREQAAFLMQRNAYFSFSGSILFENRTKARAVFNALPLNRILAETDAPDARPPDVFCANKNEKRNVPENLPLIIREFAAIRKTDFSTFCAILDNNARAFLAGAKND